MCVGPSSVVKEVGGMPDHWPLSDDNWSLHIIITEGQGSHGPDTWSGIQLSNTLQVIIW